MRVVTRDGEMRHRSSFAFLDMVRFDVLVAVATVSVVLTVEVVGRLG